MFRTLFFLILIAAAVAFFTVPTKDDAERALGEQVMAAIAAQDITLDKGAAGNALLIGCKLRPSDCMKVLRTQISARYDDYRLFSTYDARGLGMKAWCIGAYTQLFCPGGLQAE